MRLNGLFFAERERQRRASLPVYPVTGMLFQHIEPTWPEHVFNPEVGWDASPAAEGNEIGDALLQFDDPRFAMQQLERLKRERGFQGGKVFASFDYENNGWSKGPLKMKCGISKSNGDSWKKVNAEAVGDLTVTPSYQGTFKSFKIAPRSDRVRAIAKCLAELPGMPELKPAVGPGVKNVLMDPLSRRKGLEWIKRRMGANVRGTDAQFNSALNCALAEGKADMKDATGDTIVVKALKRDDGSVQQVSFAVTSKDAAKELLENATEHKDFDGLWPSSFSLIWERDGDSDPWGFDFRIPYKEDARIFETCRKRAGLSLVQPVAPQADSRVSDAGLPKSVEEAAGTHSRDEPRGTQRGLN